MDLMLIKLLIKLLRRRRSTGTNNCLFILYYKNCKPKYLDNGIWNRFILNRIICVYSYRIIFCCSRIIYITKWLTIPRIVWYRILSQQRDAFEGERVTCGRQTHSHADSGTHSHPRGRGSIQEGEVGRKKLLCISIRSTTTDSSVVCSNTVPIIFWALSNTILAVFDCE